MTAPRWRTWLDQPQNVPFRRALYLIHLWVGIVIGLYILMISRSRSVSVVRPSRTRRFFWHLHSAAGLWGFILLFGWATTGIYFAFPEPFEWFFNSFDNDATDFQRPGEGILLLFIDWHFGRFGGLGIRILWVALGPLPAILFCTGFVVWWKRIRAGQTGSGKERQRG